MDFSWQRSSKKKDLKIEIACKIALSFSVYEWRKNVAMTKRSGIALIVFILAAAYGVSIWTNPDSRPFKIEKYRKAEATELLKSWHPDGSSLELLEYTMRLSDMNISGKAETKEDIKKNSFSLESPKSCCIAWYGREFLAVTSMVYVTGMVYAEYDLSKRITNIRVSFHGGW